MNDFKKVVNANKPLVCILLSFAFFSALARAWAEDDVAHSTKQRVVYPKKTELDFEGQSIHGEIQNPGELYFQRGTEEKFDSLVKRRKNFHREMLRDVMLTK